MSDTVISILISAVLIAAGLGCINWQAVRENQDHEEKSKRGEK